MTEPITDHAYRPDRQGQWQTGRCDKCGEPKVAHHRPAASPGGQADDRPTTVESLVRHIFNTVDPAQTGYEVRAQCVRLARDLGRADDGRTEELRALNDDWWTALYLAASDAVDHVPYAAASEYPVPHAAAFRAAVEPFIAQLLAATGRGDDGAVQRVLALAEPGDPDARMDAYYYGFEQTGVGIVDDILSAVAQAGKSFHGTDMWSETETWVPVSMEQLIQRAADAAAARIRAAVAGGQDGPSC